MQNNDQTNDIEFSIIVPVYNVEGFLRKCLESLTKQSFPFIEIIIVNDKSPDCSFRIIEEYENAAKNVVTINLPENVGLGRARNAGMRVAKGKYLAFVDSDDWVEPDMFEYLQDIVSESSPDLVLFNYVREYIDGKSTVSQTTYILNRLKNRSSEDIEKKQILFAFNVAWNKIYKRSFVERLGIGFGEGYYEDLAWTFPLLIKAEKMVVTNKVLYHYRQRHSSILNTTSTRHMDVFRQYERLFELIENDNIDKETRLILCNRMINHYIAILTRKKFRIPVKEKKAFFLRFHDHLQSFAGKFSHKDILLSAPHNQDILIKEEFITKKLLFLSLVKKKRYLIYKIFSWLTTCISNGKLFFSKKQLLHLSKRFIYEKLYLFFLILPIDKKLAVFSSYWGEQFSCNPKWIALRLQEADSKYKCIWESTRDFDLPGSMKRVKKFSLAYYYYCARAKIFINNVNFPDFIKKRKSTLFIQTQHGTPLKTMGFDFMKKSALDHTQPLGLINRSMRWDYVVSSNSFSSEIWKGAFPFDYKVLEVGYPRNDVLFDFSKQDVKDVKDRLGIPFGKKILFYAPTHREYEKTTTIRFDINKLYEKIGEEFVLLIRAHHLKGTISHICDDDIADFIIDVTDYPEVQHLNIISDVLLTDYSSIMFDFACLNRPIILFLDDFKIYSTLRGMYFDILDNPPGAIVTTSDELIRTIENNLYTSTDHYENLKRFRERFCQFDSGVAGKSIVETIIEHIESE